MTLAVEVVPESRLGRGCAGKIRYRSLDAAQEHLLRLAAEIASGRAVEKFPDAKHSLSVYVCDSCGFYHTGHRPRRLART